MRAGGWAIAMGVVVALGAGVEAAEWHAAPEGKADGDGGAARPWDLATALKQPAQVQPGDTIWLHGGTYVGAARETFTSSLKGVPGKSILVKPFPGERAIVSPTLTIGGEHTWYWGFEVENPDPKEYGPVEHARWPALWLREGESIKLINLVVHGGGQGIGAWEPSKNLEIYGCVIFHNGWAGSNQGHAIYTQNRDGTKRIEDNVMFNQLGRGYGVHAYGSARAYVDNFHFEGNVSFNNQGNNFLFGGGRPSENVVAVKNFAYAGNGVRIGYTAHNKNISVRDSYFATRCSVHNWDEMTFTGNTVVSATPVQLDATKLAAVPKYEWDRNTYFFTRGEGSPFAIQAAGGTSGLSFDEWKKRTGFDGGSSFSSERPKGKQVFVRPNRYEPGRAHVIIYNWDNDDAVDVDATAALKPGDAYEVRDVQDYFGDPVASGTYAGGAVRVPMKLTKVAQPVTRQRFEHTPPEFSVFVLQKVAARPAGN